MSKQNEISPLTTNEILDFSSSSDCSAFYEPDFLDYSFLEDPLSELPPNFWDEDYSSVNEEPSLSYGFHTLSIADQLQNVMMTAQTNVGLIGNHLRFEMVPSQNVFNPHLPLNNQ